MEPESPDFESPILFVHVSQQCAQLAGGLAQLDGEMVGRFKAHAFRF